jgi:hypothetical protein
MAALINSIIKALDIFSPKQIGEKGHVEYGWSNNIREKIVQFSFQVTRTNEDGVKELAFFLRSLLTSLKHQFETASLPEKQVAKGYLSILYRMIGHTRDIIDGKGEYTLAYMMIREWDYFYPELAKFALRCFVTLDNTKVHQYGSWKDLKYFCKYCSEQGDIDNSPLIIYSVELMNKQLRQDYKNYLDGSNEISLAAKWAPREKSSFGRLYNALAIDYFGEFLATAKNDSSVRKATLKCKTDYRKLLSILNKKIDTLQIKQCGNEWSSIDFNKVTSISLGKNKKAFLNIKKNGEVRCPDNQDRNQCAEHFNSHIQKAVNGEVEMKGKRVGMADFTKQAYELFISGTQAEKDLLNSQWRDNSSQNGALGKMIAMVDVSGSMSGDPMDVAIAIGIRIAEKSVLGKRIMTFSAKPTWVNLDPYPDFISQVEVVKCAEWGMNTNFHAALDMILDSIVANKMAAEDVQDMVLVILSDMQMDHGDSSNKDTLYQIMDQKYSDAGIRVNGTPYKPPHILFWNLKSTTGFPNLSDQSNTSMMAGFSPTLLNLFCEQGLDALQSCTPWSLLVKSLENERYEVLENKLSQEIFV